MTMMTTTMLMMTMKMMTTPTMMMKRMPHVSRYPEVEAEVPLLRRALQLLTIFGPPGHQKTSKKYTYIAVCHLPLGKLRPGVPKLQFF